MKRIAHLDEYDIVAILDLKEKVDNLVLNGLPFSFRGHVFSNDIDGFLIVDDKRQSLTIKTSDSRLIKFIIDYVVVSDSM